MLIQQKFSFGLREIESLHTGFTVDIACIIKLTDQRFSSATSDRYILTVVAISLSAFVVVASMLTLPATVVISRTSKRGLNTASAMATASSMPGQCR